jgi:hypothetical protein
LLVTPQHTIEVGALSRVAQLVKKPGNILSNCSPAAAKAGRTRL